jgi:hypothetical protein
VCAFREYGEPLVNEMILQNDGPDPAAVPEDFEGGVHGGVTVVEQFRDYIEQHDSHIHMED